jgi:1,4-dihydroxy-2-naphthoyl-CoA hydrolase
MRAMTVPSISTSGREYLEKLGIDLAGSTTEQIVGTMPVDGNLQPDGWLHGGATMSLIETLASYAAAVRAGWPERVVRGLQQTCNFISTVRTGHVRGVTTAVHIGRTTHVWDVDVTHVETGRRVASGRVTMAVREPRAPEGTKK